MIPAHLIMAMAGPGGAKAIGLENLTGIIAPGARADIIELDIRQPHLQPLYNPISHLAYAVTGREVKTVLVDGEVVVENGRINYVRRAFGHGPRTPNSSKYRTKGLTLRLSNPY